MDELLKQINVNKEKYEKYLETLSDRNRAYVEKMVQNTIYISTGEMIEMVRRSLHKVFNKEPKYNLMIPDGKIGSEHFILTQLKDELNPIQVIRNNEASNNDYPIIIMDDAIYSSVNMCGTIDGWRYSTNCKNKFYCVVAILSQPNVQVAVEEYYNAEIIADKICDDLVITKLFPDYSGGYFYTNFGLESSNIIPVYFEHKIANAFGTYQFYKEIIDKPVSRKVINDITRDDIEKIIAKWK